MKVILKIALAELRSLFYSPVSWFVILAFYIINAFMFFDSLEKMASTIDAGKAYRDNFDGLRRGIFNSLKSNGINGFYKYLYLFVVLLTMNVFNREVNSGSIKLLYSSPVRNREVILGKFGGIVLFNLIFLLGAALLLVTGALVSEKGHLPQYFSILLALFLLTNMISAIGIFFSTVTKYQIVSGVLTFIAYSILGSVMEIGLKYDLTRTVTGLLAFRFKYGEMASGLITSRALIYFVSIVALFMIFSIIQLKRIREKTAIYKVILSYVVAFALFVSINFISSRPGWVFYADVTKNKEETLHPDAQAVIKKFDGSTLKTTMYINLFQKLPGFGFPRTKYSVKQNFWDKYLRFYPNITIDYVYYYAIKDGDKTLYNQYPGKSIEEIASLKCQENGVSKSLFVPGISLDNYEELEQEDFMALMKLEYKQKSTILRTLNGTNLPDQINVAGQFMRLIRDTNVVVTFLSGNLERSIDRYTKRDYGVFTNKRFNSAALVDRGVDVETISVKDHPVPDDVQLLVIADPKVEYTPVEIERINQYIDKGGNAIIFTEPGKQFILNPVLNCIGVNAEEGILTYNTHLNGQVVKSSISNKGLEMSEELNHYLQQPAKEYSLRHNAATILTYEDDDKYDINPIISIQNDDKIWLEKGHFGDSAASVYESDKGDVKLDSYVLGLTVTRNIGNKEQRIIVASDAGFMSNGEIDPKKFNHHFYSWGLYNSYPIYCNYPFPEDVFLKLDRDEIELMKLGYVFVLPTILFFLSFTLLTRRRKK